MEALNKDLFDWEIDSSWNEFFQQELSKEYFINLIKKIKLEYAIAKIFPNQQDIFKVFKLCPLNSLKVIWFGQDPYHNEFAANGIAFSINNNLKINPSLRNIFKELKDDLKIDRVNSDLTDWCTQGVFLINCILTVYEHQPLSCKDWNWDQFIKNLIKYLNSQSTQYIYVLLGNQSISLKKYLNTQKDFIIESSHPSPLGYYKGFKGSKIFSKINQYLKQQNKQIINWQD